MDKYKTKVFSQFGQDGVIERIFSLIGTTNKFFVEFGSSGSDEGGGNTPYLRTKGFDGLLMDASKYTGGIQSPSKYIVHQHSISVENIIGLLHKYSVPKSLDFISIDIDGNDYWVWKELCKEYGPKVVCIESNFSIPTTMSVVQPYKEDYVWDGSALYGASALALKKLGDLMGYHLVAVCGSDLVFVSDKVIHKVIARDIGNVEKLCLGEDLKIFNSVQLGEFRKQVVSWDGWVVI